MFFVEQTQYGGSVRAGTERLGLFTNQRQALQDVRRRREELERQGEHSTLLVGKGSDVANAHVLIGLVPEWAEIPGLR
jgi:hypothetical protein